MRLAYVLALCVALASPATAKPHPAHGAHHHFSLMSLFRGSPQKIARENKQATKAHVARFTEQTLREAKERRGLTPLPHSKQLRVDPRLSAEYRYCRPETVTFLLNVSSGFYSRFHRPLTVTSCVRSFERQEALKRVNGNAARGGSPERLSLHLTGLAADITKVGMTERQKGWLRSSLAGLQKRGRVDVTEERLQDVFHVVVKPSSVDKPQSHAHPHGHHARTGHRKMARVSFPWAVCGACYPRGIAHG